VTPLIARLAAYLRARPGVWIDGRELAGVGGFYAFRSRLSDLRQAPHFMTIENRQRRCTDRDGCKFVVSEYRFLPPATDGTTACRQLELMEV
jgi:hypothetical protein